MNRPDDTLTAARQDYRRLAAHLAHGHDIRRTGTAGQLTAWHAHVHWLACTPTHDPTTEEPPR